MTNFTRREFIERAVKGGGLLLLLGTGACSNKISEVLSPTTDESLTENDLEMATQMLKYYCNDNYNGYYLSSKTALKKATSYDNSIYGIFARDSVVVVDDFSIISSTIKNNEVIIKVRYKYYGVIKGDNFYRYTPQKRKDPYLYFNFPVINVDGCYYVSPKLPSFCSKDNVLSYFQELYDQAENLPRIDQSRKLVFKEKMGKIINSLLTI